MTSPYVRGRTASSVNNSNASTSRANTQGPVCFSRSRTSSSKFSGRRAVFFKTDTVLSTIKCHLGRRPLYRRKVAIPLRARQDEFEPNEQYEHASTQSETDMQSNIAYVGELLKEVLSIMVEELQEPLDGALVADCYSSQASVGAKSVELGLEVFTRSELANRETLANIHDSVVQHMALDVEMVMIVQRLRLFSVTSVYDPVLGSTAIVSGSLARQNETQTDHRQHCEELRMDGLLPRPTWTPLTDSAHSTMQDSKRFGCERGGAFGVTVVHPNGERLFLLARPEEAHSPRAKSKGLKTQRGEQEPEALKLQFALFEQHVRDSLELLA